MKFGLGTVQLGMPYGIANRIGQPDKEQASAILQTASCAGIDCFDTASSYGDSEALLGEFFASMPERTHCVSTKIRAFESFHGKDIKNCLTREINISLQNLGGKIDYLLFHRANDLIEHAKEIQTVLEPYRQENLIRKVGVSVYSAQEVYAAADAYPVEIIQAPVNVLDHRMLQDKIRDVLTERGIEIHSRSVYLQGLLCMRKEQIPAGLASAVPYVEAFQSLCARYEREPGETAFVYVRDLECINRFFVGCESLEQLNCNLQYYNASVLPEELRHRIEEVFQNIPEEIINPSMWKR